MKKLFESILIRTKKLLVLILLIPVVVGAVSFILELRTPTIYTSSIAFEVGNFENEYLTNPELMGERFKTDEFLEDIINDQKKIKEIKENLSANVTKNKLLTISLKGENKDDVEENLSLVANKYLELSKDLFGEKIKDLELSIERLNRIEPEEDVVLYSELLQELNVTHANMRETKQVEELSTTSTHPNPAKKAVFGVIIGLMVSIAIVILPEVVKND